ncbi:MAG: hypothetical protein ACRCZD_01710 [Phycicoccus sp.]
MITDPALAYLVAWVAALGYAALIIPYAWATWRRADGVEPQRVSWLIWSAVSVLTLYAQISAGSPIEAVTVTAVLSALPVIVVTASLGNRSLGWGWTRTNVGCAVLGAVGVAVWATWSGDPLWAVVLGVAVGTVAIVPTWRSAWREPWREHHGPYAGLAATGVLTLATLPLPWQALDLIYVWGALIVPNALVSVLLLASPHRSRSTAQRGTGEVAATGSSLGESNGTRSTSSATARPPGPSGGSPGAPPPR